MIPSTRNKAGLVKRTDYRARMQDQRPIDRRILDGVSAEIATVASTIAAVEEEVDARSRAVVREGSIETRGRRSGTATFEPEDGFEEDEVGRPVIAAHAPAGDEAEFGIVSVSGVVLDRRRMRVSWFAVAAAPRVVRFNYIIGV